MCDDSDMKILSGRPSQKFDTGEGAATAFTREKANGNLEKARRLGAKFAEDLLRNGSSKALFGVGAFDDDTTITQRRVMFAYVVNQVIGDTAPNSMVGQSALSAFYEEARNQSQEIYEQINDSAAFSQYLLAARYQPEDPCAIGKVFSRLCGRENEALFVEYGCELADFFTRYCAREALEIRWVR